MAKTLSTMTSAPASWAMSEIAAMSKTSSPGLDGVSMKTHFVGRPSAAFQPSRPGPSTMTVSTPSRGRRSVRM